jgi:hypothetical protein
VEAWLRCGPTSAWHTVVAGHPVVEGGEVRHPALAEMVSRHRVHAERIQAD